MKKIINRKKYDTETAELVKGVNFECCEHRLYRKKSGEFFLYYRPFPFFGGEATIDTMSEEDVKDWLEQRDFFDVWESLFGIIEE